ncbi:hypothetical protein ES695_04095 [Candidatus Atribacteria bacterium 1244-E10-H5-B2]|nr:MAG: hypothetical protein ES695_04095 [Candidatus Atribacteria bacterium 1244-E10-H5-B2]
MIKQVFSNDIFLKICDKLQEVKECRLNANTLYTYMLSGIYNKDTFTYASYDNGKMNGCLVLRLFKDMEGNLALLMLFVWVNAHYPKLLGEFVDLGDKKAKEINVKKIYFIADRNEKVIERRTSKFGFKRAFTTYEKEVKDV